MSYILVNLLLPALLTSFYVFAITDKYIEKVWTNFAGILIAVYIMFLGLSVIFYKLTWVHDTQTMLVAIFCAVSAVSIYRALQKFEMA